NTSAPPRPGTALLTPLGRIRDGRRRNCFPDRRVARGKCHAAGPEHSALRDLPKSAGRRAKVRLLQVKVFAGRMNRMLSRSPRRSRTISADEHEEARQGIVQTTLTSNGRVIDQHPTKFGWLRESSEHAADGTVLRERLSEDG